MALYETQELQRTVVLDLAILVDGTRVDENQRVLAILLGGKAECPRVVGAFLLECRRFRARSRHSPSRLYDSRADQQTSRHSRGPRTAVLIADQGRGGAPENPNVPR